MSAFPEPHPKLRTLEPMVGRWRLHGRTDGAQEDDISGTIELDWLPGGHFLRQHTLIDFAGIVQVDGIELVGYEPETDSLARGSTPTSRRSRSPTTGRWRATS